MPSKAWAVPESDETDGNSKTERRVVYSDEYDQDSRKQEHRRTQGIKNWSYWALLVSVGFGMLVIFSVVVVWLIHVLAPEHCRWLSQDEVQYIKTILFSGALSASITMLAHRLT